MSAATATAAFSGSTGRTLGQRIDVAIMGGLTDHADPKFSRAGLCVRAGGQRWSLGLSRGRRVAVCGSRMVQLDDCRVVDLTAAWHPEATQGVQP